MHHFCVTKEFQITPDYSVIYRLERHLTVFYIAQIVPSFVVLYLNMDYSAWQKIVSIWPLVQVPLKIQGLFPTNVTLTQKPYEFGLA